MLLYLTFAFLTFAGPLAFSPGPLNVISLMFGVSRNTSRAAPFILGGAAGFGGVWMITAALTDALARVQPAMFGFIKYLAMLYFLWLAYRIIQTDLPSVGGGTEKQPKAMAGAVLAILNPQSWVSGMLAAGLFLSQPASLWACILFGLSYSLIVLAGATAWLMIGAAFQKALFQPAVFRLFRYSSAGLLVILGARIM